MCRMIGDITTLDQFLITLFSYPENFRPACCDNCGRSGLWLHGFYHRKGDRSLLASDPNILIPIPRFLCPHCGVTCSRLPEFLSPRRWYPWCRQALALLLTLAGVSDYQASAWVEVTRYTIGRWRRWLEEQGVTFAFHLRSLFPELVRAGEGEAFWMETIRTLGLAKAMRVVCRQGVIVP